MFIVIYCQGDDLLYHYEASVLCIIIGYSVDIFALILLFVLDQCNFFNLFIIFFIILLLILLFRFGISIWAVVLLDKVSYKPMTFLQVVMIIYIILAMEGVAENIVKVTLKICFPEKFNLPL